MGAFVWEYSGIKIYSGIGKFSFAKRTNIPDILAILMRLLSDRPVTIELCNFPVKWAFFSVISRNTVVVATLAGEKRVSVISTFPQPAQVVR